VSRRRASEETARVQHQETRARGSAHYKATGWHHEQRCLACGGTVDYRDQGAHDAREADYARLWDLVRHLADLAGVDPDVDSRAAAMNLMEAAAVARAEGAAEVTEESERRTRGAEASVWRGGLRQAAAVLAADCRWLAGKFRRRPAAVPPVLLPPERGAQWQAMAGLIATTTSREG
jgi:hypothetical protein